jgi:hypothetical protein
LQVGLVQFLFGFAFFLNLLSSSTKYLSQWPKRKEILRTHLCLFSVASLPKTIGVTCSTLIPSHPPQCRDMVVCLTAVQRKRKADYNPDCLRIQ